MARFSYDVRPPTGSRRCYDSYMLGSSICGGSDFELEEDSFSPSPDSGSYLRHFGERVREERAGG